MCTEYMFEVKVIPNINEGKYNIGIFVNLTSVMQLAHRVRTGQKGTLNVDNARILQYRTISNCSARGQIISLRTLSISMCLSPPKTNLVVLMPN